MSHVHTLTVRSGTRVADRRALLALDRTDRLHLLLAMCCGLTGTAWGVTTALLVLTVLVVRRRARRLVTRSVAARRLGLAAPQRPDVLHPAGQHRQAVAGP